MNSPNAGRLLGNQQPRVAIGPRGVCNHASEVSMVSAAYGVTPDPWSFRVLQGWTAEQANGKWAASQCGLSVPRQNGKNVGTLEALELYKLTVLGRRILHTAHEVKTTRKTFQRLATLFESRRQFPELAEMVQSIRRTNGQEEISLKNGGNIEFIARTSGSGRGYTVDDLVCDEAQELSEEALAALLPAISAAPSGNPQRIYTGTPPGPGMDGGAFTRFRSAALDGAKRAAWFEWSVEGAVDVSDRAHWAATNPSLGRRLDVETIEDELAAMSPDTFARERLGMWPVSGDVQVVDPEAWAACASDASPRGRRVFAVDMSPDRGMVAVGVAALWPDGRVHVECVRHEQTRGGLAWLVDWLAERREPRGHTVVIDRQSPAMTITDELERRKVGVLVTGAPELVRACGGWADAVRDAQLTHFDQPGLNMALAGAKKRTLGDAGGWAWNRRSVDVDITPLVAVTLAHYGVMVSRKPDRSRGAAKRVLGAGGGGVARQARGRRRDSAGGWQQVRGAAGAAPYRIIGNGGAEHGERAGDSRAEPGA